MELDEATIEKLCSKGVNPEILRTILRDLEKSPQPAQLGGFEVDKGGDSLPIRGRASPNAAAEPAGPGGSQSATADCGTTPTPDRPARLSQAQLTDLSHRLMPRDFKILKALKKYRFLFTNQLQRLFFTQNESKRMNTIYANRALKKLREYGVVDALKRSIGGFKAGSSSMIWHLTEPGYRLLNLNDPEQYPRKRFENPSTMFLEHTLAIAETAVQLHTICKASESFTLKKVDPEPSCWRTFKDSYYKTVYLKPDLYAVTVERLPDGGTFQDSWFIEMDLGTEAPTQIVEKCQTYLRYYNTGIEQDRHGVFPFVVWLVKNEARKQKLIQYIRENTPEQPKLFMVITPDLLGKMVRQYLDGSVTC